MSMLTEETMAIFMFVGTYFAFVNLVMAIRNQNGAAIGGWFVSSCWGLALLFGHLNHL
jgi:hypothetical protein